MIPPASPAIFPPPPSIPPPLHIPPYPPISPHPTRTQPQELDFVAANVLMALIADFMLAWLPAPTLALAQRQAARFDVLGRLFAGCPDNAFQKVQPGQPGFSVVQRVGAPVRNGLKLFGVGLGAR